MSSQGFATGKFFITKKRVEKNLFAYLMLAPDIIGLAIFSFIPVGGASTFDINAALLFTLIGAFCFLLGSLLMLPEAGMEKAEVP